MKNERVNYLVVGSFTLVVLVGLLVFLALLTGRTGATDAYFTTFRSVPGIASGTQVLFQGYRVGHVEAIEPMLRDGRPHYRVDLSVQRKWRIPEDSVAYLTTGLLAAVNVNIDGGESASMLAPGAEIRGQDATDVFAAISSVAGDANDIIRHVDLILEKDVRPLFEAVATEIAALGERLRLLLSEENVGNVRRILGNLDATSSDVASLAGELHTTRKNADAMLARIDAMVAGNEENVDRALLDLRYALESVARHIEVVNRNLEATSVNLNDFSREIRSNPSLLLRGKPPPVEGNGRP
jgi:phospholipid/cholesterol/gamma-HCH transport system substrate-binding protein